MLTRPWTPRYIEGSGSLRQPCMPGPSVRGGKRDEAWTFQYLPGHYRKLHVSYSPKRDCCAPSSHPPFPLFLPLDGKPRLSQRNTPLSRLDVLLLQRKRSAQHINPPTTHGLARDGPQLPALLRSTKKLAIQLSTRSQPITNHFHGRWPPQLRYISVIQLSARGLPITNHFHGGGHPS